MHCAEAAVAENTLLKFLQRERKYFDAAASIQKEVRRRKDYRSVATLRKEHKAAKVLQRLCRSLICDKYTERFRKIVKLKTNAMVLQCTFRRHISKAILKKRKAVFTERQESWHHLQKQLGNVVLVAQKEVWAEENSMQQRVLPAMLRDMREEELERINVQKRRNSVQAAEFSQSCKELYKHRYSLGTQAAQLTMYEEVFQCSLVVVLAPEKISQQIILEIRPNEWAHSGYLPLDKLDKEQKVKCGC